MCWFTVNFLPRANQQKGCVVISSCPQLWDMIPQDFFVCFSPVLITISQVSDICLHILLIPCIPQRDAGFALSYFPIYSWHQEQSGCSLNIWGMNQWMNESPLLPIPWDPMLGWLSVLWPPLTTQFIVIFMLSWKGTCVSYFFTVINYAVPALMYLDEMSRTVKYLSRFKRQLP